MSRIYPRSAQKRHHKNDTKKWKISLKNGSSPSGCIMSFKVLFLFSNFYFYIWLITSFIGENWLGGKFIYTFFYLCFLKFFSKFLLFCSSFLICVSNFELSFYSAFNVGFPLAIFAFVRHILRYLKLLYTFHFDLLLNNYRYSMITFHRCVIISSYFP